MVLDLHYGFFRHLVQPTLQARWGPLAWVNDGAIAVFGFFSLSGYLVAEMVLSGRYRLASPRDLVRFVLSRWARLYPLYWLVLLVWVASQPWPGVWRLAGELALLPYGIWSFFYDQQRYGPLFDHLLLVPSWTLALDLVFYPIGALLVLRRWSWLLAWLTLCLAAWVVAAWLAPADSGRCGYSWWHFRYWTAAQPALFAFLLGLALRKAAARIGRPKGSASLAIAVVLWCSYLPFGLGYFAAGLLATLALAWLVHLMAGQGRGKHEALLGNMSYAIYLIHIPVITWLGEMGLGSWLALASVIGTLCLAALLAWAVEAPVEAWRRRWFGGTQARDVPLVEGKWTKPWLVALTLLMAASTAYYCWSALGWVAARNCETLAQAGEAQGVLIFARFF
jgi:peptidoglycan/LPS O-acetylase OafA/YrhL